jgi:hypothetical protein
MQFSMYECYCSAATARQGILYMDTYPLAHIIYGYISIGPYYIWIHIHWPMQSSCLIGHGRLEGRRSQLFFSDLCRHDCCCFPGDDTWSVPLQSGSQRASSLPPCAASLVAATACCCCTAMTRQPAARLPTASLQVALHSHRTTITIHCYGLNTMPHLCFIMPAGSGSVAESSSRREA